MPPEIKIIYQLCHRAIFESQRRTQADIKAWVATQHYLLARPLRRNKGDKANEFSLLFNSSAELYAAIANDCNRFSQASIESMWLISKNSVLPRSTGWAVVQLYYSAFYAAHSLLRMFGRSCTQLTYEHVRRIYEVASVTGQSSNVVGIENGFYYSSIQASEVIYKKVNDSHADTWNSFAILLDWIIQNIPNTTGIGSNKTIAMTLVTELKALLSRSGATRGNWASKIRNKVHYQHSHGVWFPYRGAFHNSETILNNLNWRNEPSSFINFTGDDISSLCVACNCIVSTMYHLLKYGYENSGKVSYPMKGGVFKLLNQLQVV